MRVKVQTCSADSKPLASGPGSLRCRAAPRRPQLRIEITSGVTDPIPIAIVPFARRAGRRRPGCGRRRAARSRRAAAASSTMPRSADDRDAHARARTSCSPTGARAATTTSSSAASRALADGQLAVDFELINVLNGQQLATQRFTGTPAALRNAAHRVSDVVYEKILGVRGAFATRIAYVSVDGAAAVAALPAHRRGCGRRESAHRPGIALTHHVARVVGGRAVARVRVVRGPASAVYVQRVRTRRAHARCPRARASTARRRSRRMASKLALTLGGSGGNPDIYVLDLATQGLTRITDDPAIDTEAGVDAGRQPPVLHVRPRRRAADLSHRRARGRAAEAHHLQRQLQRAPARLARTARSSRW